MNRLNLLSATAVALLATTLAGCAGGPASGGGVQPLTPTSRYSLQVEPGIERIALAVHPEGLSPNQRGALIDIANRFALEGAPVLRIEAPAGADTVGNDTAWKVRTFLESAGVPSQALQVVGYDAPDPRAPVLVGYDTVRAVVPQCGTQWGSLTRTGDNGSASNFGCAVNANLAAQITDPRDIVQPRAMGPIDGGRRAVVFQNYRGGAATSAEQEPLVGQQRTSDAVQ